MTFKTSPELLCVTTRAGFVSWGFSNAISRSSDRASEGTEWHGVEQCVGQKRSSYNASFNKTHVLALGLLIMFLCLDLTPSNSLLTDHFTDLAIHLQESLSWLHAAMEYHCIYSVYQWNSRDGPRGQKPFTSKHTCRYGCSDLQ